MTLSPDQYAGLIDTLKTRFERHMHRHEGLVWSDVQARLEDAGVGLQALYEMELTGGEPDVIGFDESTGAYTFCDCSPQSPTGRRSICYDPEALASRKQHKPAHSAIGMADEMGIKILSEEEYRALQQLEPFDTKTSSWIETPPDIRELGGAIFGDYRFGHVFIYHNGAESYYAARGFRGKLKV